MTIGQDDACLYGPKYEGKYFKIWLGIDSGCVKIRMESYLELTLLFMSLATNITFIWFFSSVHSHMDIECAWRPPVTATYRTADWCFCCLLLIGC